MKKPTWEDDFDTFDREALAYAQALTKFGADIEQMYRIGVELNVPAPQGSSFESTGRSGSLPDPTGDLATNPRRQQRAAQLREARRELELSVKHMRKALYASARASTA